MDNTDEANRCSSSIATTPATVTSPTQVEASGQNGSNASSLKVEIKGENPSIHDTNSTHDSCQIAKVSPEGDEHGLMENVMATPDVAAEGSSATATSIAGATAAKKRKSKKKSKTQRRATGFEEYYVDPPLTPDQHSEEVALYALSRPFMERIEIAIQRYTAKRNLDSGRKDLFDKYLKFGGIDSGPKMFSGGLDSATLADSTAAEIALLRANHTVPIEREQDSIVDFESCVKAFLSSPIMFTFDLNRKEDIQKYIGVIRNFLNYLLHHDVCPEYIEQIHLARMICGKAQEEIWSIVQAQPLLPGSFNVACSELFGGIYRGKYDPSCEEWMSEEDKSQGVVGFSHEKAGRIFTMGFAAYGSNEQMDSYKRAKQAEATLSDDPYQPKARELDLKITDLILGRSNPEVVALYKNEKARELPVLGVMKTTIWKSPWAMARDLTHTEEMELLDLRDQSREMIFWVDDKLLEKLHVGMYLEATVRELNFGVCYFDAVQTLRPTFFMSLANEQMLEWRKIESEWRPPKGKDESQVSHEDQDPE